MVSARLVRVETGWLKACEVLHLNPDTASGERVAEEACDANIT